MDLTDPGIDLTRYDAAMFIYNLGVIVSTPVLYDRIWPGQNVMDAKAAFVGVSLVLAVGWTLYFNFALKSKLQSESEAGAEA